MRIREIAAFAGVTTRTIRHHHVEPLPEQERLPSGHRVHGVRDSARLGRPARACRAGGLVRGPAEVRNVLAKDTGRDLPEALETWDAVLARRKALVADRGRR